ncbi:MAG: UDP-3-O-(3-hydroxymyristoyl)glucosamine N-acyltransferase [Pseudomonadota bacterium]
MPSVSEIAKGLGFEAVGDTDLAIARAAHPRIAGPSDLALALDAKHVRMLGEGGARAAILSPGVDFAALGLEAAIIAPRARYAMAGVTQMFQRPLDDLGAPEAGAHPSAVVDPSAEIDPSARIGPLVVVGAGARIEARSIVLAQATIGSGAEIGADCILHPGVRVGARVRIGARCQIHPNAVIGADGFSFVTPERGSVESARETGAVPVGTESTVWARIHSLGAVKIGDDVEIGAGAAIDRGTVADTEVGDGSKLDNQVQIGHNARVGRNCLLCGQVGVAGSAVIGDRVVIGGQAGVADHTEIGDDTVIMASSGVSGQVKPRSVLGGTPALPREEITQVVMSMRRLPRLLRDVAALKKRFPE